MALTFLDFSTEECCDSVTLYDGYDDDSSPVIALLKGTISQTQFYSTQQYMFIKFATDIGVTSSGFNATYQSVTPASTTTGAMTTGIDHIMHCLRSA